MKLNNTVVTLALLGVLALAALAGGLLPAGNAVEAAEPRFVSGAGTRTVDENTPPGVNIGAPISATDTDEDTEEFGDTLTYSLEASADTEVARADAASFDIDPSTGQLITKAPLDADGGKTGYTVTVRVDDGESRENPLTPQTVQITVTPVNEAPAAPAPPTVVSGKDSDTSDDEEESTMTLYVVWHPPEYTGSGNLTYNVQYKKSTDTGFGDLTGNQNGTTATIPNLDADTSYDVRVQANGEILGPWSFVGTGSTNKEGNSPPQSTDAEPTTRRVRENTPAGENIESPVAATDQDTTTLTYDLGGPDADLFNFNTRTGQIRTKVLLNHEDPRCYDDSDPNATKCLYYVTVTVSDGVGGTDATGVTIAVEDSTEAPLAPARPTVRATENSSTSLDVSWNEPGNKGPAITSYEVEYRKGSETFSDDGVEVKGTTATISGTDPNSGTDPLTPWLAANTSYEVRVRAINDERTGPWSASGTGRTNRANHQPIFDDRPGDGIGSQRKSTDGFIVWRTIDENPGSGRIVGRIFADDADNDSLSYKLIGTDAGLFDFNETNGEIRTKAGVSYSYEDTLGNCGTLTEQQVGSDKCYEVTVEVRDGLDDDRVEVEAEDADDSITVKIGVRDRDEPPAVPTVTVTSPAGNTTLVVILGTPRTRVPLSPAMTCSTARAAAASQTTTAEATQLKITAKTYLAPPPRLRGWMKTRPTRCRCGRKMKKARAPGPE